MSLSSPPGPEEPEAQSAEEFLKCILTTRGHHKIIIGASPGVGKTFRMLQEAHGLKHLGVDVVVGYFEPHGRQDTIELLDGLEILPRQKIDYKGITLEEMDLQGIIQRH